MGNCLTYFAHPLLLSVRERLVVMGLLVWALLSLWNQYLLIASIVTRHRYQRIKWDPLTLIPCWTFWASPPSDEWQLLYRDKLSDGTLTSWKAAGDEGQHRLRWIWNPDIRKWKAIRNYCSPLLRSAANGERQSRELYISRSYVALALYVSAITLSAPADFRQFMIARTFGFDQNASPEILFVSPLFRVGERA
jgi:hypothetical protein